MKYIHKNWLHEEHKSGRPILTSLLYEETPKDEYSYGRQNWFDVVGKEHRAARRSVAVFDKISFTKFTLKGRDVEKALSWICAN